MSMPAEGTPARADGAAVDPARRQFLALALVAPAAVALGSCGSGPRAAARAPVYFSSAEKHFVDAATARLIPADALGGGANEAGVTDFIDLQLAGAYGRAERWYMRGPWPTGTDQQGFQLKYTPAQIYREAIAGVDAHCARQYGKPFAQLAAAQQDEVLHALEDDRITLDKLPARSFFALLWQNTQEGYLADPAYGGNRDFAGWKLIGFPGPRYNYVEDIERFGQPYTQPFVSLVGRNPGAHERGEA